MEIQVEMVEKKEWHRPQLITLKGSETLVGYVTGFTEGSKGGAGLEGFFGDPGNIFGSVAPS